MSLLRNSIAVGVALALAALLGACSSGETDPANLEGTWVLIQFQEGNASDPLVESTIMLKEGRLSGNGGVDDLKGAYDADDEGELTFKRVERSRKAGPMEAVDQETRLVDSLAKVAGFEVDEEDENTRLELRNEYDQTLLVFLEQS